MTLRSWPHAMVGVLFQFDRDGSNLGHSEAFRLTVQIGGGKSPLLGSVVLATGSLVHVFPVRLFPKYPNIN
jgi:hypothetical protein